MQDYEDSEGQPLGEDGAAAHREALANIKGELASCTSATLRRDLERECAHLVRDLAAGLYLPVDEEAEAAAPAYSYEISPRPDELGGGWRLRLLQGEEEVGGGVFPVDGFTALQAEGWWRTLPDAERAEWAAAGGIEAAYRAFLLAEAYADAESTAYEWLDSREN